MDVHVKPDNLDHAVSDEDPSPVDDGERFKCPFPDCKRSFAALWRLKVHYRAAPDVRGSGCQPYSRGSAFQAP